MDLRSNRRQIQIGKQLAEAEKRIYRVDPKMQRVKRITAQITKQTHGEALTFRATRIGIRASQKTIDHVKDRHLRFINST